MDISAKFSKARLSRIDSLMNFPTLMCCHNNPTSFFLVLCNFTFVSTFYTFQNLRKYEPLCWTWDWSADNVAVNLKNCKSNIFIMGCWMCKILSKIAYLNSAVHNTLPCIMQKYNKEQLSMINYMWVATQYIVYLRLILHNVESAIVHAL